MAVLSAQDVLLDLPAPDAKRESDFERFLGEQRGALVGFLRHRAASEADAQDIAQESMVRLVRYRARQSVEAWKPLLYRIAINLVRDYARRQRSHNSDLHCSLEAEPHELVAEQPSQEQRLSDAQELLAIRDIILKLPSRCRQIYLLNRIEGMSYSQISQYCDISVKAVEKHIAKALRALRQGLGERGFGAFKEP